MKKSFSYAEMKEMGYPELREIFWNGLSPDLQQKLAEKHGVNLAEDLTKWVMDYSEGARLSGRPETEQYISFDEFVSSELEKEEWKMYGTERSSSTHV